MNNSTALPLDPQTALASQSESSSAPAPQGPVQITDITRQQWFWETATLS